MSAQACLHCLEKGKEKKRKEKKKKRKEKKILYLLASEAQYHTGLPRPLPVCVEALLLSASSAQHDCLIPTHLATVSYNASTSCIPTNSPVMHPAHSLIIIPVQCSPPLPPPPTAPSPPPHRLPLHLHAIPCTVSHSARFSSLCTVSHPPTPLPHTPRRIAPLMQYLSAHMSWPSSCDCTLPMRCC